MIRVGPAGWSYPDWEGRVYPAHKPHGFHALSYLARTFDTIEINSSFYAMPRAEHAERWIALVADHPRFRFQAKLNRDFTHLPEPGADDPRDAWEAKAQEFQAGIAPLVRAKRLTSLLVQFPVTFLHGKSEVRRLGRLRALFPDVPLVLDLTEAWRADPREAAALAHDTVDPATDLHATADYRRHLARVLTIRAARQAISAARERVAA